MMSRITTAMACFIFLLGAALALPSFVLAGSATLNWQANTEADFAKYRVYYSTTAGAYGSYKAEVLKGTTTYVASNLTDGQTYYFVLTAVDTAGNESGFSSPVSKAISGSATAVPSAPVMVSPANGSNVVGTSVAFTWQAAQGATDYNLKIYSSTGAVTFDQWLGNVTSKTVTGFANAGQSQSWSVTARNTAGTGPASAPWTFTNGNGTSGTVTAPVLVYPANGSTVGGTSIPFRWNAVPGATQYVFRQWKQNGDLNVERNVGNVTAYTMGGFSNSGYTNSWSVTALNAAGQSASSAKWTFTNSLTTSAALQTPVMVSPGNGSNVAGTSVTFTWQAASGATDYNLKIYSSTGALTSNQWLGNVTSKTIPNFANAGQSQSWSITARNSAGTSPESAQWTFTNGNGTSGSLTAPVLVFPANGSTVSGTSITFRWNAVPGATGYIFRQWKQSGELNVERSVGNVTSYTFAGFSNMGYTNSWSVSAVNAAGQNISSAKWTFTNK